MKRATIALAVFAVTAAMIGIGPTAGANSARLGPRVTPRWVLHVHRYPGGISGTVRMSLRREVIRAQARLSHPANGSAPAGVRGAAIPANVQVNTDSSPGVPQNEEAVAVSTNDPQTAVVASNDYIDGGLFIGTTHDGGHTWRSWFESSVLQETRDFCTGGDPSVVYSARDHKFFASQLCFFRAHSESAMEVIQSRDNGNHWTPARYETQVISNVSFDADGNLVVDDSVFYDKEQLAVDNFPSSPHYGRLYMTYIKFHLRPDGFSDYCPVQLAYTDQPDPNNDGDLRDATWTHQSVQPDNPGGKGLGTSANQGAQPAVDGNGGLGISFFTEECNTSIDHHIYFKRLRPSGTWGPLRNIDKDGQFVDNPDPSDLLTNKLARLPASTSAPLVWNDGRNVFQFITQNNVNADGHVTGKPTGADITYTESHDFGAHWSDMQFVAVKHGQPAPRDQFLPWMAVDQDGAQTHAIWLDNRRDPNNTRIDTFEVESNNLTVRPSGNTRISTVSWNPNDAFFTSGAFIGDYSGLAEGPAAVGGRSDEYEYPMWTDGRNNPGPPHGDADVFTVPN